MMAERIAARESYSAQELANEFNVSILAVHRDLDDLWYRLDDSTSALHMISGLAERAPLHVSTTFLVGLRRLAELPDSFDMTVVAIGGRYDQMCDSFVGSQALAKIANMRLDALFMSAPVLGDQSIFHQVGRVVGVKKDIMEASKKVSSR